MAAGFFSSAMLPEGRWRFTLYVSDSCPKWPQALFKFGHAAQRPQALFKFGHAAQQRPQALIESNARHLNDL